VVHSVGAYNMTQWMQFIALRPAIVMIDMDGNSHIIRKRETLDSIEKDEVLPKYLKNFKL
jgi:diaminopimelate decarboxylase